MATFILSKGGVGGPSVFSLLLSLGDEGVSFEQDGFGEGMSERNAFSY